jgi:quercetin dioxygenase-like cupin family protein
LFHKFYGLSAINHNPSLSNKRSVRARRNTAPLSGDLRTRVGDRLGALMERPENSLEKLAMSSGLGLKKLAALIAGDIVPTIDLVWKIANALGVPYGSLTSARTRRGMVVLRQASKTAMSSSEGRFTSRALFPHHNDRLVEFYELTIAPGHVENADAHAPGTLENLVVIRGRVEITAGKEPPQSLREGDAIVFEGDVPHSYRNLGATGALLYLMMSYVDLADA